MIRIGTLCLLLAPHSLAGRVCTVTTAAHPENTFRVATNSVYDAQVVHDIDIHGLGPNWVAPPSELRPLNDPDNAPAADVTRREVVRV